MARIVKGVIAVATIVAGVVTANPALIAAGISIGTSALKPKPPRNSPANADRLRANVDPLTPRKTVIGYTAMATDIRDEEFTNNQEQFHRFIVCASHKVQSIEEIWFDDELAWSTTTGIQSKFLGYLGVETYAEGGAATAKNISARMGSTRRYTGLAWVYLRYKLTGNSKKTDSPFAQSIPTRITIRGRGAMLPDPRNPAHDMGDQSTWTWNESASRNPALALLFYLLGWRINGKLAVGKGIPASRVDLDSFITAANICDELVPKVGGGTEPRYRCDGMWSEGDSPTTVIDMLKATMNADLDDVGGKLRLTVFHNDLATPIAVFGDNDIIDSFNWQPTPSLDATFNVVRGLYTDASNTGLYQQVDYPEQRDDSPDDIDRIETFNLPMVQSAGQAQRLAQIRLQRQNFGGVFEAEFQATAWKVTKNSIIRLTFGQTGFVSKFFRVAEMDVRRDGRVPLKLREEDPAIYGEPPLTGPIDPVFSTPFDPTNSPFVQAINRWQGQWSIGTTYILDDLVTGPGSAGWRYINETPAAGQALPVWPATSNAYWQNFTAPVDPPDIGIESGSTRNVPRGSYDAGTTYVQGDSVLFAGSSYQLIVASSVGNAPPDALRWALLANAGSGPAGADGLEGISVIVTNEAHTVATDADGSGGDYITAGGQMILRRGVTVLTPTFSIAAQSPATGWITINASTGVYTVTDPGVVQATATIRANWAGVNYERTYTLAQSRQGVDGPNITLISDAQAITFTDGVANPSSQTITLTALLTNLSGTVAWSTTPAVTLGGTGNTRTVSSASFPTNRQVTVTATLGGITDKITIVRTDRDISGAGGNLFRTVDGTNGVGRWVNLDTVPTSSDIPPGAPAATRSLTIRDGAHELPAYPILRAGRYRVRYWIKTTGFSGGGTRFIFRTSAGGILSVPAGSVETPQGVNWTQVDTYLTLASDLADAAPGFDILGIDGGTQPRVYGLSLVYDPTGEITIGGDGILNGIGTGGVNVDNRGVIPSGLASARPASGTFPGQAYFALDTRVLSRWDGFQWIDGPTRNTGALADLNVIDAGGPLFIGQLPVGKADPSLRNTNVIPSGLLSARPASGAFINQAYYATDTRDIFTWDGFNWRASSDLTATVSGAADLILNYSASDVLTSTLPVTATYALTLAGVGAVGSGVSWSVAVLSGTFAGAAPTIVGSGSGQLRINSGLSTNEAVLRITASIAGRTYPPISVTVRKLLASPPAGGVGALATDTTLTTIASPSFFAVTNDLSLTLPSGVTEVTLNASALQLTLDPFAPEGSTNCEFKWQRETSPSVWTDVGAVATAAPPQVVDTGLIDGGGNPIYEAIPGSVTCNRAATGLAANSVQRFRLVGRITGGNTRNVFINGTASAAA